MKKSRMVIVFGLLLAALIVIVAMAVVAPRFFRLESPASRAAQANANANTSVQTAGTPQEDRFFLAKMFEDADTGNTGSVQNILGVPRWRADGVITYSQPGWSFTAHGRYIPRAILDPTKTGA